MVVVPGNHDHHLLAAWLARRGASAPPPALALETEVDWQAGDLLAEVAADLAPARVCTAYPGLWLRPDVYAIHGHYLDLHLSMPTFERLSAGVMGRIVGLPETELAAPDDYELVLAPIYAWIQALAERVSPDTGSRLHTGSVRGWDTLTGPGRRGLRRRALIAGFPLAVALLSRAGIRPLRAEISGPALRRAGLRGMEVAVARLKVGAEHIVFGHTHRAGPLPGDDAGEWRTATGARLLNTGCWVEERAFLGSDPSRSPYRVGFAAWVADEGPPELVNLLDF